MKTTGKMMAGLMLLAVAAGCGPRPDSALLQEAELFFGRLRDQQVAAAYAMLAEESRATTDFKQFEWGVEALGLAGNQGVKWAEPYLDDDYGRVEGEVTTRNGSPLKQELVFFRKGRKWELHIVREPPDSTARLLLEEAMASQPAPEGMRELAAETIGRLADALESGDFGIFHRDMAPQLREGLTPEALAESFAWLAEPELELDWKALRGAAPVLEGKPVVDPEGRLALAGHVEAGGKRVGFQMDFVYETPMWMLTAIRIRPPL
jgi:hypothetical protein